MGLGWWLFRALRFRLVLFRALRVRVVAVQSPWGQAGGQGLVYPNRVGSLGAGPAGCPPTPPLPAESFGFVSAVHLLNVSASDRGRSDSLLLSWDEPEGGARGYLLVLSSLGSDTLLQNGSAGANATSFWFHGLTPGTRYEVEVTATLVCMDTAHQTVTAQTSKAPVRNLSLSSGGSTASLRAAWAHGHGQHDQYHLELWHSDSQSLVSNVSLPPSASTFLFHGLLAGSEYALRVSTLAGSSQASTSVHQWTAPSIPTQLRLSPVSSTSLVASWAEAAGAAWLHLELRNLLTQTVTTSLSALGPNTHNFTFLGLSPGTQYFLKVTVLAGPYRSSSHFATEWTCESDVFPVSCWDGTCGTACKSSGDTDLSGWREGSGDTCMLPVLECTGCALASPGGSSITSWVSMLCSPPDPLSLANVSVQPGRTPQELHVSWVESGGGRDHLVQLSVAESLSIIRNVSVPRGVTQLDLEGLVPGSRYRVEIISQAGPHRISSQTAIGYTGTAQPPAPASLHTLSCMATALQLSASFPSWTPAAPTNLSLTNPGSSSELHTSWSKPPGGRDHYHVTLYSLSTQSRSPVQTLSPDALNMTWTDLEAGSEFAVQVTAVKGSFEASSIKVTQWTSPPASPTAHVSGNTGHPDRLSVAWGPAAGGTDGYALTLYHAWLGTMAATASLGRDIHNFTFTGLAPGHEYSLEATATTGQYQAAAPRIRGWTRECPGQCPLQRGGKCHTLGEPGQCSTLTPLHRGVCHPTGSMGHSLPWRHSLGRGQVQQLLQGLIPGRNYSVSLSCVAGPYWSSTKPLAVPVEPNPVTDVQCLPESRSLYLNWTSSPGDVEAYEVVAERLSEGNPTPKNVLSIPSSEASLEGLEPNSTYQIVVSTVGMNALRSQAVTLLCSTAVERECPSFPQPCTDPGRKPQGENGQIEYYGVIATTNDSLLRPTQETMSSTWYDHYYGTEDSYLAVLIPNPFHQRSSPDTWRVPVGTEECGQSRTTCNGKLKANEQYRFSIAAFTKYDPVAPAVTFTMFSGKLEGGIFPAWLCGLEVTNCQRELIGPAGLTPGLSQCPLTGWPEFPVAKASFPLDFIPCRNVHRPVPLQSFKQYYEMKTANANHAFFQEFEELKEVGKEQSKVEAELPANASKNRYPHVLPYDHSRVKLSQQGDDPHSDYINANFMPGYTSQQEFIATQGPLKKTIEDFWRLVWEQNVCNIIMLTVCMENGRVLCDHYWPSESAPISYGQVRVQLLTQSSAEEWTTREFKLWHRAERFVSHLHYTSWPDHGIPESTSSIMAFRELVREHIQSTKDTGPTLVHCSAGVGRSGTFIALDRLLQQMKQEKAVDIFGVVYALRMNRYLMIQTLVRSLLSPSPSPSLHSTEIHTTGLVPSLSLSCPIPLKSFAQHYAQKAAKAHMGFLREYEVRAGSGSCREHCHSRVGGVSQIGTLISLDCLLHQMKAERTVDIYVALLWHCLMLLWHCPWQWLWNCLWHCPWHCLMLLCHCLWHFCGTV
uniref:protein-tyrosine-phosphatase n=1 Tax=Malurus cyaneus samueli TaxID=2593467 RepID=A0A8C5T618_9PASS